MSANATPKAHPLGVSKVSRAWSAAVDVEEMKDAVQIEAKCDAERLLRTTKRSPVPVYPADIAWQIGVRVEQLKLSNEDTIGGLIVEPESDPRIVLNSSYGLLRRRMTCALELGYYVGLGPGQRTYERADLRSLRTKANGEDPDERYADEFARCLLMPEDDVRAMAELGLNDLEMSLRFWVQRDEVWSRLRSLGLRVDLERKAR